MSKDGGIIIGEKVELGSRYNLISFDNTTQTVPKSQFVTEAI